MPCHQEPRSCTIPAGEDGTAIVGATGSGKTTLVKLLLRFYDVTVRPHMPPMAMDIRDLRLKSICGGPIGFVSQVVYLFHGTVRENVAYGSFDATLEEMSGGGESGRGP